MNFSMMYPEGLLSEDDLRQIAVEIRKYGAAFDARAMPSEPQMAVKELVAPIVMGLTSDGFLISLAAAAAYDIIKSTVLFVWEQMSGKIITYLYAGGVTIKHPVSMDLMVSIDDRSTVRIKLEGDLPVELRDTYLTQAINLVRQTDFNKHHGEHVVIYDARACKSQIYTQNDFIEKYLMNEEDQADGANS
ncbi:MAG TPA: hypothetical protein PLG04_06110 [Anaerolineaceae bacterium]|nr:hypothetical protein [Candidatus Latescibacterota bacterium]HOR78360.1 hypothetical protein [Anaerolineaceae bacterium]